MFRPGMLICYRQKTIGWGRAEISEMSPAGDFLVSLVDYGTKETVGRVEQLSRFRTLPECLREIPSLAVNVHLPMVGRCPSEVSVLSGLMEECVTRHREAVAVRVLASLEAPHQLSNIIRGHLVDLNNVPVYQQLWEEGIIEGM